MAYVDGFILAVPRDKLDDYKKVATVAGEVWMSYGAKAYVECVGDDTPYGELTSFPRSVQAKDNEVVVFSWIVYGSKEERDSINAKVMADERLKCDPTDMPFDAKRMIFGGFTPIVEM